MSLGVSILIGTLVVALAFAGLLLLLLSLFSLRFDLAWFGVWTGGVALPHETSVQVELGFPGFMWKWGGHKNPSTDPHDSHAQSVSTPTPTQSSRVGGGVDQPGVAEKAESIPAFSAKGEPGIMRPESEPHGVHSEAAPQGASQKAPKDPNRFRKALFRFVTDGPVWSLVLGYVVALLVRAARLLHARMEFSLGHPDPAFLGRMAGRWYAVAPLFPKGSASMNFRFQDRQPAFGARLMGGFSLLSLLWFLALALLTFPLFRLARRAWQGWRLRHLTGWRAWTYRKIQSV
jgi:hypothetical protein